MKNPFKKQDHTGLTAAIMIVGIATGIVSFLYLTKYGEALRNRLSKIEDEPNEHATDYLTVKKPKKRKQTTDIHDLDIIPEANS